MKRFEGVFIGDGSNPIGGRKKVANFGKIWRENRSTRAPRYRSGPLHLGEQSLCTPQRSLGVFRLLAKLSPERATMGVAVAMVQRSLCMVQRAAGRLECSRVLSSTFFPIFSAQICTILTKHVKIPK